VFSIISWTGVPVVCPLEHTRQDSHLVRLTPLRGVFVLSGFAHVQPLLDHSLVNRHTRRAAIHCSTQCRPMAFTPCGHAEKDDQKLFMLICSAPLRLV